MSRRLCIFRVAALGLIGLLGIMGTLVACGGSDGTERPAATATLAPTPTPAPTPIAVTATQLKDDYESNEVAAGARYEGNYALITGVISSITEAGSKYDVKVQTDDFISITDIVCKIDKDYKSEVLQLSAGQTVSVQGKVKGKSVFDIDVEDCRVVK